MKTIFSKIIFIALASSIIISCSSDSDVDKEEQTQLTEFNISFVQDDVWTVIYPDTTRSETDYLMSGLFLFNPDGSKLKGVLNPDNNMSSYTFTEPTHTGTYTIYGFAHLLYHAIKGVTIASPTQEIPLTLSDICLGKTTVDIVANTKSYSATVNVSPIMGKLNLTITDVPANITSITATIPNQASTFTLSGIIAGNTNSQDIAFTQGKKDENSKYSWSTSDQLIYPSADNAQTMIINISASDGNHVLSYGTTAPYCCKKGMFLTLTTSYNGISVNTGLTESPWTETKTTGDWNLGDPTFE